MALNPNIALAVKGPEFADPMAMYGRVAAIQQAQNQNALAQYQLSSAQREDASTNALNAAYRDAYNPQTGEIDTNRLRQSIANQGFGSKLPGIEKAIGELQVQKANLAQTQASTDKTRAEILDSKLKQSRQFLDTIDPTNPAAPQQYLAWHEANHKDPVIGPALAARGVTAQDARARIDAAVAQGPQAFANLLNQSKLGTEKFIELNKPNIQTQDSGSMSQLVSVPGLGGPATVVQGSQVQKTLTPFQLLESNAVEWKNIGNQLVGVNKFTGKPVEGLKPMPVGMSPYEANRIAIEQQRLTRDEQAVTYHTDENGNIVALPSKLKPGQVPTAVAAVAPGTENQPLGAKPSEAVTRERNSLSQQQAIVAGALKKLDEVPDAFGAIRGAVGETIGSRMSSPAQIEARSYLFNVVSGVIKERAGTAQSAAEAETLARFLPQPMDNADIIKGKLNAFQQYLTDKEKGLPAKRSGQPPAAPTAAGAIAPPSGFKLD
jgi:hypothetical protein